MPPVGFEPTISAVERPQTYALDRAATETGYIIYLHTIIRNPKRNPWLLNIMTESSSLLIMHHVVCMNK